MRLRILPSDEWSKVEASGLPGLLSQMRPEHATVFVVEDDDKIVGTLGVLRMTHFEGIWVDPAHRNGFVIGRLLRAAEELVRSRRESWVIGGAANDDEVMDGLIRRRGGLPLPMRVYAMPIGEH